MKILYLIDQFHQHGGVEKMLSLKIRSLMNDFGYEVLLVTFRQEQRAFVYPLPEGLVHIDLNIDYDLKQSYFSLRNLKKVAPHFYRLRKLIRKEKPDIIISTNFTPDQYFLPFIEPQIPKVKEIHSSGFVVTAEQSGIRGKLFDLYKKYDKIVVLNKDEAKYYPHFATRIIPNFIETSPPTGNVEREKTVLAAGRIAPVKQFDHLIAAWAQIADRHPDWNLKIFGDGPEDLLQQLKAQITSLGLQKQVSLPGATAHLNEEMAKSKIYAMTSATECFPMVLLEAMQQGLAIISYDCPHGPRNIIEEGRSGILTKYNDVEAFASALDKLIGDSEKITYFAANSKQEVAKYNVAQVMQQWNHLFHELIEN